MGWGVTGRSCEGLGWGGVGVGLGGDGVGDGVWDRVWDAMGSLAGLGQVHG